MQQDICNGCGYCIPACPFGVVDLNPLAGKAHKCTLCYDRLKGGLEPACSKACPTDSIQFGEVGDLQRREAHRVGQLHEAGTIGGLGHLAAFFLLTDRPEVYNLPAALAAYSRRD